jgi:hypothetical protein
VHLVGYFTRLSLTSVLDGVGWSPRPRRLTPGERPDSNTRLGRPKSRSGRVRKFSPPTGIRSPARPARSEYTGHSKRIAVKQI